MEEPPNCFIAKSKDILVLVDGFSNIIIIDFPSKGLSASIEDLFWPSLLSFLSFASSIIFLSKEEELEIAKQKGFDKLLYYTWTCWYPKDDEPCNECKMCKERIIECRSIGDTT